jgi:hypothetical protein
MIRRELLGLLALLRGNGERGLAVLLVLGKHMNNRKALYLHLVIKCYTDILIRAVWLEIKLDVGFDKVRHVRWMTA